jgi:hypothetical protein
MKFVNKLLVISAFVTLSQSVLAYQSTSAKETSGRNFRKEFARHEENHTARDFQLFSNGKFVLHPKSHNSSPWVLASNVFDFQVSKHKSDVGLAYFINGEGSGHNHLYMVGKDGRATSLNYCPTDHCTSLYAMHVKQIDGVFKFDVVDDADSTIELLVLTEDNVFTAWDNERVLKNKNTNKTIGKFFNIHDYKYNENYGIAGYNFATSVAFLLQANPDLSQNSFQVIKLNGKDVEASKVDTNNGKGYKSLQDFYRAANVKFGEKS